MKKLLFIMNPCAGIRKANPLLPDIFGVFNRAGYEVSVWMTEASGDAERIVQEYVSSVDLIVCSGGDGTFNETLSGLMKSGADVPIGYIPAGSTNDFASSLKLSADPIIAAQEIVSGVAHSYDAGRFNGRYFSYVASFGAFTKASYATPQSVKNALGHMAYVLSGIQELGQLKALNVRIEAEDRVEEGQYLFGAICNSTSVGGILTLDPRQVDMRDGKFEVLLVHKPKSIADVGEWIMALQRQQYNSKMMTFFSASSLKIQADPDMTWTLDGERADGSKEIFVENVHHAYRLMKAAEE